MFRVMSQAGSPAIVPSLLAAAMRQGLEMRRLFRPAPPLPDLPHPHRSIDYHTMLLPSSSLAGLPAPHTAASSAR